MLRPRLRAVNLLGFDLAACHEIARRAEFPIDSRGPVRWRTLTENFWVRARPGQILEAAKVLNSNAGGAKGKGEEQRATELESDLALSALPLADLFTILDIFLLVIDTATVLDG